MGNSALSITGKSDDRAIRDTITQNAHGFAIGDVVRVDSSTGIWAKAQANSAANAESIGVVESITSNSFIIIFEGELDLTVDTSVWSTEYSDRSGSTNPVLFLSAASAGAMTEIPPSSPGEVIKPVMVWQGTPGTVSYAQVVNYRGTLIGGENVVDVRNIQPVGTIMPFGGTDSLIPTNWLLCDGGTYSISASASVDLYNVIGYAFGSAAGGDYFAVPDMRGRVPLGSGALLGSPPTPVTSSADGAIGFPGGVVDGTDGNAIVEYQVPYMTTNFIIMAKAVSNATIVDFTIDDTLKSSGWSGEVIGTVTNRDYTLTDYADHAGDIKKFSITSRAGGACASIFIGPQSSTAQGTAVGFASGITLTNVGLVPSVVDASGDAGYVVGSRVVLSISGVTNAQDFQFSVTTLKT